MSAELWEKIYESLTCHILEPWRMPGVINAFSEDSYCMEQYRKMRDAYDRLCDRLGVEDEDKDIETIISCYMGIQQELCKLMFAYGQQFPTDD